MNCRAATFTSPSLFFFIITTRTLIWFINFLCFCFCQDVFLLVSTLPVELIFIQGFSSTRSHVFLITLSCLQLYTVSFVVLTLHCILCGSVSSASGLIISHCPKIKLQGEQYFLFFFSLKSPVSDHPLV